MGRGDLDIPESTFSGVRSHPHAQPGSPGRAWVIDQYSLPSSVTVAGGRPSFISPHTPLIGRSGLHPRTFQVQPSTWQCGLLRPLMPSGGFGQNQASLPS